MSPIMMVQIHIHYKSERIAGRGDNTVGVSPVAASFAAAVPALLPKTAPEVNPLPPG